MNQIERSARESQGDLMYNLTWRARKGENKWWWVPVALLALLKLLWRPVLYAVLAYVIVEWKEGVLFEERMMIGLWVVLPIAIFGAPFFEALLTNEACFAHLSNFIAIAGDMNRLKNSTESLLVKFVAKIAYFGFGALALYCALSIYAVNSKKLEDLYVTKLDVLGTALAKAAFWKQAEKIYGVIGRRHVTNLLLDPENTYQVAVSYALASKWMLDKPGLSKNEIAYLKGCMREVMRKYNLPPEVTMRLKEGLEHN